MKKNLAILVSGSILEYYDFAIYLFFAKQIGNSLIPSNDPKINLLITLSIYLSSALIRPLGGLIFGHIGDSYSRKRSFNITISLMALSTLMIGLIPNTQTIGYVSVIILIMCRFIQSFAVGGEVPASIVYAYENSPKDKKPLYTNIAICGTNLGLLVASLVCQFLDKYLTGDLVWRSAFIIGGVSGLIFAILRKNLTEPQDFIKKAHSQSTSSPLANLYNHYSKQLIYGVVLTSFIAAIIGVFINLMPSYLNTFYQIPLATVLNINSNSIIIFLLCSLIAGKYYYVFNRRFFLISLIIFCGFTYLLFRNYGNISLDNLSYLHYLLFIYLGIISGRLPLILNNLFDTSIRYTGVALAYNSGFGIIGGLTQLILLTLIGLSNLLNLPAYYIMLFSILAWVFFFYTSDTILNKHEEK